MHFTVVAISIVNASNKELLVQVCVW